MQVSWANMVFIMLLMHYDYIEDQNIKYQGRIKNILNRGEFKDFLDEHGRANETNIP